MKVLKNIFAVLVCFLVGGAAASFAQSSQADEIIKLDQYPLKPDKDLGGSSARVGEGRLHQVGATIIEIPPGGQLAPHRHLMEEMIYIISGKGHTFMWNREGGKKERYEWSAGDLLSPSLNAWHQHVNSSADTPARYISLTSAPVTLNLFNDPAFLASSDFIFADRWQQGITQQPEFVPEGADGYADGRMSVGHFLQDLAGRKLHQMRPDTWGLTIRPEGDLAGNKTMEMEVREYHSQVKVNPESAHRHPWEVVYIVLDGEGSTRLNHVGEPKRTVNWEKGDMYIVEANEVHLNGYREGSLSADSDPRVMQIKVSGYFLNVGNIGGNIDEPDDVPDR